MAVSRKNFWCSICSRTLSNRSVYEHHLKSKLHQNRLATRNELEEAAETLPSNCNELSKHVKENMEKIENLRILESLESLEEKKVQLLKMKDADFEDGLNGLEKDDLITKKYRSCTKITCELCNIKLSAHHFGNHLISMFHYRKMLKNPDQSYDTVLNNFHKIIVLSPFICGMCRYYFNTQEEFMKHFQSTEHLKVFQESQGIDDVT